MVGQRRIQGIVVRLERGVSVFRRFKRNDKGSSIILGICSRLCMLSHWIACVFVSVWFGWRGQGLGLQPGSHPRLHLMHRLRSFRVISNQRIGSSEIVGRQQKSSFEFYVIFVNPDFVAEIVSWWPWKSWYWALPLEEVWFSKARTWIVCTAFPYFSPKNDESKN